MKLVSFSYNEKEHYGIYTSDGIIDLKTRIGTQCPDLKSLLAFGAINRTKEFLNNPVDFKEEEIYFLPVIPNPNKILCVGMNYLEKRIEFNQTDPSPTLFIRFPDSQIGHKCNIVKPKETTQFDYEGELAIIIGKKGKHISKEAAFTHIAGYSCYMDGSARDWQHTWFTAGKNWPKTGGFGPYLTTADAVNDPENLEITTYLNGIQVQRDNTKNLIHKIPDLVAYISLFTELSPGDIIITGSPGGVGKSRVPPLFMKENDCVEVEIEQLGKLTNYIIDEA